jgi:hypothetical protein
MPNPWSEEEEEEEDFPNTLCLKLFVLILAREIAKFVTLPEYHMTIENCGEKKAFIIIF